MSKTPNTLFIDLNTHRIRAGINNQTLLDTPNTINKKSLSFNPKYIKNHNTIFLNNFPIISNLTNLEFTMDLIFDHLKLTKLETYDLILTVNPFLPKYFEENLVKFLFQLYGFKRIQLGFASLYSLNRFMKSKASANERFKDSLIINCGFSCTYVLFNDERFYLPAGQSLFLDLLQKICGLKFRSPYTKKNYDYNLISQHLRVSLDYERDSLELVNMLYEDPIETGVNINISDMIIQQNRSDHLKDFHRKRSESTSNKTSSHKVETLSSDNGNEESLNNDSINESVSCKTKESTSSVKEELEEHEIIEEEKHEVREEEKEELEDEEEQQKRLKKEALAENLIYHSKLYQLKTKISKIITLINSQIIKNKKVYSQRTDPENYLKNLKNRLNDILEKERDDELFRRDKDIPKLINILNNKDDLNLQEMDLLNKISLLNDEEVNLAKQIDKDNLVKEIREIEPDFVYEKVRVPEILSGEYLNKQLLNIELIRIPECLFNPSIFQMNFVGLKEVFEILYKKSFKIFITGEFILKGMKERVEKEIRECINGEVNTGEVIIIPWNEKDFKFIKEFPVFENKEFLKQFD